MRKALVLLVITACGDNEAKTIPLEAFLAGRHEAECARLTRCGLFTSEVVCNAYFRRPSDAALVAAIDNDKIDYDGAAADKCIAALRLIGCDKTQRDAREVPVACAEVFSGLIEDGDACAFDTECRSGVCDAPACTRDMCCPGTCAPTRVSALDGPCEIDAQCVVDAYCHKSKTCRARVGESMSCDDARGCDFGLACIGVTELQPGSCRKLPLIGNACPYMLCAEINATCSSDFTCIAMSLPGDSCTTDASCSPFAQCNETSGVCIETPGLGEACDGYCAGESWCDTSTNTCVAPLADGAMCSADNQCASTDCFEGPAFDQCNATAVCF